MGGLPAIPQLRPFQNVDPLEQAGKALSIRELQQRQQLNQGQMQLQQQQSQEGQLQLAQREALNKAYQGAVTMGPDGKPTFDQNKVFQSISASGQGSLIPGLTQTFMAMDEQKGKIQKAHDEHVAAGIDYMGHVGKIIQQSGYDHTVAGTLFAKANVDGYADQAGMVVQHLNEKPGDLKQIADEMVQGSPKQRELAASEAQAAARQSTADNAAKRLQLETPGIQAKTTISQAEAAVAPQKAKLGITEQRATIAQKLAEIAKAKADTAKTVQDMGQKPMFAVDPKTNERVMTTWDEIKANGYTNPVPVKEADIQKQTDARAMINDVQLNKSRYATAMQKMYQEPMTGKQKAALIALTPEKLGLSFGALFKIELPDVMQKVSNASAFAELSPTQKDAVIGYYSTLASVPAAQKALTNIGRANKEMMDLELRTIPTPLMDAGTHASMLNRFQGNIDQTAKKTVRMPGMPSTQDIRAQYESADVRQPLNPAKQMMKTPNVGLQSGQQVKLKSGKTVTIDAVHPDGSFDAH